MNQLARCSEPLRSNAARPAPWQRMLGVWLLVACGTLAGLTDASRAQEPAAIREDRPAESLPAMTDDLPPSASPASDPHAVPRQTLVVSITIFALAVFVGVELISKVPATLHTPLMSGSNAISGITVVGALIAAGHLQGVGPLLGFLAVALAMINVVGGFLVTQRMLQMFKRR